MSHRKNLLALILALCLVLCACAGEGAEDTTAAPTADTTAPATTEQTVAQDSKTVYQVTVVDTDGNPIAGAMVQLCMDVCIPAVTNEDGVAEYSVDEADYKVSFLTLPEGYAYTTEEQEFHFDDGSYELTIILKAQ